MAAAAILKIAFFGHNSSTDFLISAKFCTRKQNGMPTKAMWQILQIFKIQDGGRGVKFWASPLTCVVTLTTLLHYRASVWYTALEVMNTFLLFYMCHFAMGLKHCYKTAVFYIYICSFSTEYNL